MSNEAYQEALQALRDEANVKIRMQRRQLDGLYFQIKMNGLARREVEDGFKRHIKQLYGKVNNQRKEIKRLSRLIVASPQLDHGRTRRVVYQQPKRAIGFEEL